MSKKNEMPKMDEPLMMELLDAAFRPVEEAGKEIAQCHKMSRGKLAATILSQLP